MSRAVEARAKEILEEARELAMAGSQEEYELYFAFMEATEPAEVMKEVNALMFAELIAMMFEGGSL